MVRAQKQSEKWENRFIRDPNLITSNQTRIQKRLFLALLILPDCVPATAILCPAAIEIPPIPAWLTDTGLLTATPSAPMEAWACGKETARPPNPAF